MLPSVTGLKCYLVWYLLHFRSVKRPIASQTEKLPVSWAIGKLLILATSLTKIVGYQGTAFEVHPCLIHHGVAVSASCIMQALFDTNLYSTTHLLHIVKHIANKNIVTNASINTNQAYNHNKAARIADMLKICEWRFRVLVHYRILVENSEQSYPS